MNESDIREAVIRYNRDDEEWTPAVEEEVRAGRVVALVSADTPACSSFTRVWVCAAVLLSDGSHAAAEPAAQRMRLKRGMTVAKTLRWWANKHIGRGVPMVDVRTGEEVSA